MECPIRKVCSRACLGDSEEGRWQLQDRFLSVPEGVVCMDWDMLVTTDELVHLDKLEAKEAK